MSQILHRQRVRDRQEPTSGVRSHFVPMVDGPRRQVVVHQFGQEQYGQAAIEARPGDQPLSNFESHLEPTVDTRTQEQIQARATAEAMARLDQASYDAALASLHVSNPAMYDAVVDELNKMVTDQQIADGDGFDLANMMNAGQPQATEAQGENPLPPAQEQ